LTTPTLTAEWHRQMVGINMKTYKNLYPKIFSMGNLTLAWRKARLGKTHKPDIIEFEKNIEKNLLALHYELKNKTYKPLPLTTFVLRDPKTRIISKSDFRDRVVHHALVRVLEPIYESTFICDSCANRKGKGTHYAIKRLDYFIRKVSDNYKTINKFSNGIQGYCLKADIKHYFNEVNHEILINLISKKIKDSDVIWLIRQILNNCDKAGIGMPLGNLTSQFLANLYLDPFDKFVKQTLKLEYYLRYVDDFIILNKSREELVLGAIEFFLKNNLKLRLHPQKSRIIPLSKGIDFVGFRNFAHHKLLRKRNIKNMKQKIKLFEESAIDFRTLAESYQGWQAYANRGNTYRLRRDIKNKIINVIWNKLQSQ
jgi:RNA-directed DNA polymerase